MISINLNSEIPIYTQLCHQIIQAIAKQEVTAGEPMPTVRQLAEDLGINPMTVNKAYGELKHAGYLEANLRRGTVVKEHLPPNPDFLKEREESLRLLIAEALLQGVTRQELIQKIEQLYIEFPEVEK